MNKRIGVVGYRLGDTTFGAAFTYLNFIKDFGTPVIISPDEDIAPVDALLLPGGPDLAPRCYGQDPSFFTNSPDIFRQHFFDRKLENYIGRMPIFGICLGFQMLNVYFGGSITQHMPFHKQSKERYEKAHEVFFLEGKVPVKMDVNSHHHQAVYREQLGGNLIEIAHTPCEKDKNHKIVEAFKHRDLPIAGVQWHPEEWFDELSAKLFNEILNS